PERLTFTIKAAFRTQIGCQIQRVYIDPVPKAASSSIPEAVAAAPPTTDAGVSGLFARIFGTDSTMENPLAEVQEIQQRLTALGFDTGGTDGRVGNDTMKAVQDFQRKTGMEPADGYAGVMLLARLRQGRCIRTAVIRGKNRSQCPDLRIPAAPLRETR